MVKHCSDFQRKMYDNMRQQIVNHFCPDKTVEIIDSVLAQIRRKRASFVRSSVPKESEFKCNNCGHNEAWVYPTHDTCKKCAVVKDKIHKGKAYRDIKDREGDLNGVGMPHDSMMSQKYNFSTVPKQHADPKKRVEVSLTYMNPKGYQKHIMEAKREFDDIGTRLHFNTTPKAAIQLFASYLNGVGKLTNKPEVHAACFIP